MSETPALVYVSDGTPGLRRRRAGKGFVYLDADGVRIANPAVLARIRKLAIPPAYADVWICADPLGHLQATGRDARGRKQYRYHPRWRQLRDRDKFGKLVAFGAALPRLRQRLRRDLALPGLPRDKVLAIVVSLLGATLARIGNREYLRDNGSYGLSTLRARHLALLRNGQARLRFCGKSGQVQELEVNDARLTRLLRRCQQLPGQALFQYVDGDGARQPIDSGMVNNYLREVMDDAFTAKDFRTWGATALALAALAHTRLPPRRDEAARNAACAGVVREVAGALGNTPAICRASYIAPVVFAAWRAGYVQRHVAPGAAAKPRQLEASLLRLLRDNVRLLAGQKPSQPRSRRSRKPPLRCTVRASAARKASPTAHTTARRRARDTAV